MIAALGTALMSCDNSTSLQEYYVENQDDKQFLALDIPASLLTGENSSLDAEQRATLETIRKVNLLAFPKKLENEADYEAEKEKIAEILKNEKYQPLMRYGGGDRKAELFYVGEEDAIDEFIVYGADESKGFGVARVLGNDMEIDALLKLFKSVEKGDLNIDGLQELMSSAK